MKLGMCDMVYIYTVCMILQSLRALAQVETKGQSFNLYHSA